MIPTGYRHGIYKYMHVYANMCVGIHNIYVGMNMDICVKNNKTSKESADFNSL